MSVNLSRGENVSLTKEEPTLTKLRVGLGWRVRDSGSDTYDLDCCVFLLNSEGRVPSDQDFVFYNNLLSPCGSVRHEGDNLEGENSGDDAEQITVDLSLVPSEIERIVFAVSIYQADIRLQDFGMIEGAYMRLINENTGDEVVHFNLSERGSFETTMIFGELYRYASEWKFKALAQSIGGGLAALATGYGVNIES
jgi:tellurium resistance protein TerD